MNVDECSFFDSAAIGRAPFGILNSHVQIFDMRTNTLFSMALVAKIPPTAEQSRINNCTREL